MVYPTLRATVREGRIQLMDQINLPENAFLLVTIVDENAVETLSLGERLAGGLQDILHNRVTLVNTTQALTAHLDKVFTEAVMPYRFVFTAWFDRDLKSLRKHNPDLRSDFESFLSTLDAEAHPLIPIRAGRAKPG